MPNRNNLQRHQRSDKIKWAVSFFLIAVLMVGLAGVILQAFTPYKPSEGFKPNDEQQEQLPNDNPPVLDENGNEMEGGRIYPMSNNMVFSAPTAFANNAVDTAAGIILEATIIPDTATDKTVEWEVAFQNPDSAWATDKIVTDYVTVESTESGALTAVVNCLQAFGEKIEIKVVSCDNPSVTATCVCDYAQRVESVALNFGNIDVNLGGRTDVQWQINVNGDGFGGATELTVNESSVYTIVDTFTPKVELIYNFIRNSDDAFHFGGHLWHPLGVQNGEVFQDITFLELILNRTFLNNLNLYYNSRNGDIYLNDLSADGFFNAVSSIENGWLFDVKVTVTGEYSTYEAVSNLNITEFVNTASVTGIDLNNGSHIF